MPGSKFDRRHPPGSSDAADLASDLSGDASNRNSWIEADRDEPSVDAVRLAYEGRCLDMIADRAGAGVAVDLKPNAEEFCTGSVLPGDPLGMIVWWFWSHGQPKSAADALAGYANQVKDQNPDAEFVGPDRTLRDHLLILWVTLDRLKSHLPMATPETYEEIRDNLWEIVSERY